jgi:hypothetical protein
MKLRCGRMYSWPNQRYYPATYLEGLRKTMKNLSQDIQVPRLRLHHVN